MVNPAQYRLRIDGPHPLCAPDGGIRLTGWCFDEATRTRAQVRLVIGEDFYTCESGLERADVAAAFPNHPQARHSGFMLERWLPAGYALAHFELSTDGANWSRVRSVPFCSEIAPLVAGLVTPEEEAVEEGLVTISGWSFHPQEPIEELSVHFRGVAAHAHYWLPRSEEPGTFAAVPNARRCDFEARLRLEPGRGHVRLKARLKSGAVVVFRAEKPLTVRRSAEAEAILQALNERRAMLLRFPTEPKPKVSIIVAVYNQLDVTLNCLSSLLRHTRATPYELILVDDFSDEGTGRSLQSIGGVRVIRSPSNEGFLKSCNKAAEIARGDYLLFLNNDTEVTAKWLEPLLRVFQERADAGLVGSKLIFPDGRLQEAGGIIWQDASGVNYGKWDNPEKPAYNYLRKVDYCSGACVVVPRKLFEQLGGFDPRYVPAYYEDTDLAFGVRTLGRAVYYQPRSVVIHHEGVSSGTSTASGVKAYQLVNQVKFRTKWQHALARHFVSDVSNVERAKDAGAMKRVLVVDARVLAPDQDSGSVRMLNLLRILQQLSFHVTFLPGNLQRVSPYTERMQDLGIECWHDPYFPGVEEFFGKRGPNFDLVILSRAEVASVALPFCRTYLPDVPVVFDTVDLHFLREQREAELEQDPTKREKAEQREAMELALIAESNAAIVVSPVEKALLEQKVANRQIAVISNIHEPQAGAVPSFETRRDLLFIGGFEHTPNVDAMLWFCAEIMPSVVAKLPDAKLHIVGSKMPESVRALASEHIVAHGYVRNVDPLFASCLATVAPLRWGAGVKGKINQSMSFGVPVISTSIGAEGMYLVHDENVLVADEPQQFAKQIVRLHRDPALWEKLSRNGYKNIEDHFSFAAAKRGLLTLLRRLAVLAPDKHAPLTG